VCGLDADSFRFVGFLPRSGRRRRDALDEITQDRAATVVFESPQRIAATLRDFAERLEPERELAVCRELTKLHEEVARGTASELAERFAEGARGEITLVVSGRRGSGPVVPDDPEALDARIVALLAEGSSTRDVVQALLPETSLSKHDLYTRVQARKSAAEDEPDNDST